MYLGNEGRGGWTLAPQQRRASDAAPIDLLGRSLDKHEFRIRLGFERELDRVRLGEWSDTEGAPASGKSRRCARRSTAAAIRIGSGADHHGLAARLQRAGRVRRARVRSSYRSASASLGRGPVPLARALRTNNPLFPVTPWVSMPGNNVTETKLRVLPYVGAHPQ